MPTGHKRDKQSLEKIYDDVMRNVFFPQSCLEYFDFEYVMARVALELPDPSPQLVRSSLERLIQQKHIMAATFSGTLLYKSIIYPRPSPPNLRRKIDR